MSYLIIGSSSSIANSLKGLLSKEGFEFITFSRDQNSNTNHFIVDVSDTGKELPEITNPLKGIVYLPGTMNLKPFQNLTMENFYDDMKVNFFSMVRCLHKYIPNLQKESGSSIVLISSIAATTGLAFHTSISAAKSALEGFSRSLAAELAPGIRVNAVAPSLTESNLTKNLLDRPNQRENLSKRHPLQKIGSPEDIAEMIFFLLTEKSKWITGQVFHIDGGLSTIKNFQ